MERITGAAVLCVTSVTFLFAPATLAQATLPTDAPAFEVASIHPADPGADHQWIGIRLEPSGRLQASSVSLDALVSMAYVTRPEQAKVETAHAAPKWISADTFNIEARVDAAYLAVWKNLSFDQQMAVVRPMLQRLLAERFHLKLAVQSRITPVYALVQAKGGAHVKEVPPPPPVEGSSSETMNRWMASHPGKTYPGSVMCSGDKCLGHAVRISAVISQIAGNSKADRMVIDQTGLTGFYDLSFSFPDEKVEFPMQEVENDLGMKFKPTSLPVKTYLIVSAQKPSVD